MMKTLVLVVMLVLSGSAAFAIEDTVANRSREAERYIAVSPPKETFENVAKQMSVNYPPEDRAFFIKVMTQYMDVEAVTRTMKESMVKIFSADELAAMADFYGSPAGRSATRKMGSYFAEVSPVIEAEAAKAVAKAQEDMKANQDNKGAEEKGKGAEGKGKGAPAD